MQHLLRDTFRRIVPNRRDALRTLGFLAGYGVLFTGAASAFEAAPGGRLWHPSAGLNLALVVLVGARPAMPAILAATLASGFLAGGGSPSPLALIGSSLVAAAGYGGAGAWMRRRLVRWRPVSRSPLVAQILTLCLLLPGALALGTVSCHTLAGAPGYSWEGFAGTVLATGLANAVGLFTVMPILLVGLWSVAFPQSVHVAPRRLLGLALRGPERLEFLAQLAAVPAALYAAFVVFPTGPHYFFCLLPVLWMAHRGRFSRATLGVFLTNTGAFATLARQGGLDDVQAFQVFVVLLSLIGYLVGARESERQRALRRLGTARSKLHERIEALAGLLAPDENVPGEHGPGEHVSDEEDAPDPPGALVLPVLGGLFSSPAQTSGRSEPPTGGRSAPLERGIDQVEEEQDRLTRLTERLAAVNDQLATSEEQLRRAGARKDRFLTNLTHEFRTPLTLVLGPLRRLLDEQPGLLSEKAREELRLVRRNGLRLRRLVEQILDLARLDAGRLPLDAHRHNLGAFAERIAESFAPLAERSDIALAVKAEASVWGRFDPGHLEKVLGNLLSNALKFTPAGGRITVRTAARAGRAEVVVEDTGAGLTDEEQTRIFDRFFQAEASATRPQEGMGIGLALSKELVEQHPGGALRVDSTPGAGSCFTVRLPLAPAGPAHASPRRSPSDREATPPVGAQRPLRPDGEVPAENHENAAEEKTAEERPADQPVVLVVDDHADLRVYVRRILAPTYHVVEAADGRAGLEAARRHLPDVIVADVMMPGLDGFEMTRRLRQDENAVTAGIPLLFLTARAGTDDEREGLRSGGDDYLRKPFEAAVLRARVKALIARQHRLRERLRAESHAPENGERDADAASPFEETVRGLIREHLSDPDFDVAALAEEAALSRRQLTRRLKEANEDGITPARLIRRMRLERGARLLESGEQNITQVAYAVGFKSLSHFSRCFKERFGPPPSQYDGCRTGPAS